MVETLSGNWATLYLSTQRGVAARDASFALTAFWMMVTLGRVVIAFLERFVPARNLFGVAHPPGRRLPDRCPSWRRRKWHCWVRRGRICLFRLPAIQHQLRWRRIPTPSLATMSGALIAFYQVGYGVAAFGVGPLRQLAGLDYSSLFSVRSLSLSHSLLRRSN